MLQEKRRWEDAQPKESGSFLSGSGAASGLGTGALIGSVLFPPLAPLTALGGALVGGGIGAAAGSVLGKETSPRMHPGQGPYAQPGNIQQDNAAMRAGVGNFASTLGGIQARQHALDQANQTQANRMAYQQQGFQNQQAMAQQQHQYRLDQDLARKYGPEAILPVGEGYENALGELEKLGPQQRQATFNSMPPYAQEVFNDFYQADMRARQAPGPQGVIARRQPGNPLAQAMQQLDRQAEQEGFTYKTLGPAQREIDSIANAIPKVARANWPEKQKADWLNKARGKINELRMVRQKVKKPPTTQQMMQQGGAHIVPQADGSQIAWVREQDSKGNFRLRPHHIDTEPRAVEYPPGRGIGQEWDDPKHPGYLFGRDDKGKVYKIIEPADEKDAVFDLSKMRTVDEVANALTSKELAAIQKQAFAQAKEIVATKAAGGDEDYLKNVDYSDLVDEQFRSIIHTTFLAPGMRKRMYDIWAAGQQTQQQRAQQPQIMQPPPQQAEAVTRNPPVGLGVAGRPGTGPPPGRFITEQEVEKYLKDPFSLRRFATDEDREIEAEAIRDYLVRYVTGRSPKPAEQMLAREIMRILKARDERNAKQ
jgi:hypothetical protein